MTSINIYIKQSHTCKMSVERKPKAGNNQTKRFVFHKKNFLTVLTIQNNYYKIGCKVKHYFNI